MGYGVRGQGSLPEGGWHMPWKETLVVATRGHQSAAHAGSRVSCGQRGAVGRWREVRVAKQRHATFQRPGGPPCWYQIQTLPPSALFSEDLEQMTLPAPQMPLPVQCSGRPEPTFPSLKAVMSARHSWEGGHFL